MSRVLQYVELDLDVCALTFGVAPCTASIPTTGDVKCFNTIATCQDRDHFTRQIATLRFAVPTGYLPNDIECIPSIKSIAFEPAVISLGKDLGQRATLTISFNDHRHSDTGAGFDKYLSERPYDPYKQGTFWGKFAARQPFLRGKSLRWITGELGQTLAQMETRYYLVDSCTGPSSDGTYKIIAKDLLKLADGDRAMAPPVSLGFLGAALAIGATSFTISPSGVGPQYPASGFIAIGGTEIASYTRSGDVFTIVRGQLGTIASAHAAQDRVQVVIHYAGVSPDLIIADLLTNYAGVDSSYIPAANWAAEIAAYLNRVYTATIAQPTAVNTLISELIEQAGLSMWWNDRDQEIGMLVLRGLIYTNELFTENNMMANTLEISDQPDKRLSQVHTYFGQINPLTSLTDKANFRSASIIVDDETESDYGSPAIKEIFSRWIPQLGRSVAARLGTILIGRFKHPPRKIAFSVLRNSTNEIVLANGYQVEAWPLQLDTGEPETVNVQVTRLRPNADALQVETEEVLFTAPPEDLGARHIIVDADLANLNLRAAHDALFPEPTSGITVILTVNTGIVVSSVSVAQPAIDIGAWPAGVTIIVSNAGNLRGAGANGVTGITPGSQGGTVISTTVPIKVANTGNIWSGGGSGAGGGKASVRPTTGSCGGAGIVAGVGTADGGTSGSDTAGGFSATAASGGGPGAAGQGNSSGHPGGAGGWWINGYAFLTTGTWDGTTFTPGPIGGSVLGNIN